MTEFSRPAELAASMLLEADPELGLAETVAATREFLG
jgi:hypothetical protein